MGNYLIFSIIWTIGVTLAASLLLIRKNYHARPLSIFIVLYIIGQVLGYGLGVNILKAAIPSPSHPDSGTAYQVITSTAFPLILAFIIDYTYRLLRKLKVYCR